MSNPRPPSPAPQEKEDSKHNRTPSISRSPTLFYEKPDFTKTPPPTAQPEKKSKTCLIL